MVDINDDIPLMRDKVLSKGIFLPADLLKLQKNWPEANRANAFLSVKESIAIQVNTLIKLEEKVKELDWMWMNL
ncbi:MAG: hypothetical protein ABFC94_00210 [Syntrophomonas sp.]